MLQGIVDCKTTTLSYDTENGTTLITNLRKFFNKITGVDELKMNQNFSTFSVSRIRAVRVEEMCQLTRTWKLTNYI